MHVHAYIARMRTTVEVTAEQRARLMAMAARRGEKGFSKLVQQALTAFLEEQSGAEEKRRRAAMLKGVLSAHDADRLRAVTRDIRGSWR
jgi:metal-responsive CopG/Arc/MetJ family transcriptional regulator